jgi:hypothetical protein
MAISTPIAVLVGAVIIAASILFVERWQITAPADTDSVIIFRLDRWTGETMVCPLNPASLATDRKMNCSVPAQN